MIFGVRFLSLCLSIDSAVQHERAPRSCVNSNHLASALSATATHLDTYSARRMPLHSGGLILPIPMHMPASFPAATTSMEPPRYYPHFTTFHSNLFDSLHFGTGMFSKPSSSAGTISAGHPAACILPSTLTKPFCASTPSIGGTRGAHNRLEVAAKEDEVSSTEETRALSNFSAVNLSNSMWEQEAIFESAAKLLFLAVKWAKSMPSFNQIGVHDQNLLLEDCWAELFVIMAAQYGLPIGSEWQFKLNSDYANQIPLTRHNIYPLFLSIDLLKSAADLTSRKLLKSIHQILLLRLSHTEFVCLKTLILYRPGEFLEHEARYLFISVPKGRWAWPILSVFTLCELVRGVRHQLTFEFFSSTADCIGLASSYEVTMLQDEALNLLLETCGGTRMGHILLTLPYIRSAADRQLIQVNPFSITVVLSILREAWLKILFSPLLPNRNFYLRKPLARWPSKMYSAN